MSKLKELFEKNRVIGLVGNPDTGKSLWALSSLVDLKKEYNVPVYCLGAEKELEAFLMKKEINILRSKTDILDMKIKNSIIFIDEFSDLFSVQTRDKQLEKIKRFFNRIAHLNNYVLISSAQEGFWNKFMCGLVKCFIVKKIEFSGLVNGTPLKTKVMDLEFTSDYRLDILPEEYYIINDDDIAVKETFEYVKELDVKKDKPNIFEKSENSSEKKREKIK